MRACRLFFHLLNDSTFRNRKYKRSKNDLNSRMMARAGTIVTLCTHEVLTSSTIQLTSPRPWLRVVRILEMKCL